jgi:methyl-accepting chemotaxis protein
MIKNISIFWKFAMIAFLMLLAAAAIVASALVNAGALKYEYDNMYGFMLLPIIDIEQGNLAMERLQTNLHDLERTDLATDQRAILVKDALANDQAMVDIIKKYESQWVTTTSPDFTAVLKQLGKQDLQNVEAADLKQFHDAYSAYLLLRDPFLSNQTIDIKALDNNLSSMGSSFGKLLEVNQQFAALSNTSAQNAFHTMQIQIIAVSILATLIGLLLTFWISRSVTVPLAQTVNFIQEMGLGHLDGRLHLSRRDEIGVMANAMDRFSDDLQNTVIGTMKKIADGDLSAEITPKDHKDEINPALQQTIVSLRGLIGEANMLTQSAAAGKLTIRGDVNKFKGGYREIVQGMNNILAAVVEPLNMAAEYVERITLGEIPEPIVEKYNGDFELLKNNLNRLSENLRIMLLGMTESANNLISSAAEILAATTQQASGASEQSAAISQTTTTVSEVKAITEQASMRIQEVANASQRTVETARTGQRSLQETIDSMTMIKERVEGIAENILALSDQTQQIGDIIATVNEIAAQSNMLALNASVEAARAGEHGKGFAVVAMEVRNLAEQSRQATAQVKAILSEIQKATNSTVMATEEGTKGVERGVQLSTQAREAIEQLSAVINESAQIATQVVAGGHQQQTGVEQIALAMQNINQATVQNLASTRQAEKSAQNLNDLARKMNETVSQYRY